MIFRELEDKKVSLFRIWSVFKLLLMDTDIEIGNTGLVQPEHRTNRVGEVRQE